MPHQQMHVLTPLQSFHRPLLVHFTPLPEGTLSGFLSQFTLIWPAFELYINRIMHCVAPCVHPASSSWLNTFFFSENIFIRIYILDLHMEIEPRDAKDLRTVLMSPGHYLSSPPPTSAPQQTKIGHFKRCRERFTVTKN